MYQRAGQKPEVTLQKPVPLCPSSEQIIEQKNHSAKPDFHTVIATSANTYHSVCESLSSLSALPHTPGLCHSHAYPLVPWSPSLLTSAPPCDANPSMGLSLRFSIFPLSFALRKCFSACKSWRRLSSHPLGNFVWYPSLLLSKHTCCARNRNRSRGGSTASQRSKDGPKLLCLTIQRSFGKLKKNKN